MFLWLQTELMIAEASIQTAREQATFGYIKRVTEESSEQQKEEIWNVLEKYGSDIWGEFVFSDSLSKKLSENYLEKLGVYQKIRVEQEEEGNKRNIEVSFLIHSILPFFNLNEKKITIPIVYQIWSGTGESLLQRQEMQDYDVVYVTEQGEVYHKKVDCTYLLPKVQQTIYEKIETIRNISGGKYYACDFCTKEYSCAKDEVIYITKYGNRFHISSVCSAIKRVIKTIPEQEAKVQYRKCKKCGENI